MTKEKHTSGEWTADDTKKNYPNFVIRHNGLLICKMLDCSSISSQERDANARLIAACPELLLSLKWFMAQLDDKVLVRNIEKDGESDFHLQTLKFVQELQKTQTAIRKAEGSE